MIVCMLNCLKQSSNKQLTLSEIIGDRILIYLVEKLFKGDTLLRQDEECCFMSFLVTEFLCFHQLTEKGEEIKKKV